MEDLDQASTGEVDQIVDEQPVAMEDTIRDSLRAIQERNATEETGAPAAPESQTAPEAPEDAAKRLRDAQGKFAKDVAPAAVDADPAAATSDPAHTVVPKELQTLGFRKDEAAAFAAAPEILKQAIMRRSQEMHQGVEQYRQAAQFAQTMEKVITPYAATLNSLNISPDKAVAELMAADHKLRYGQPAEKTAYFRQLAQNYGIDMNAVMQAPEQQAPVDPTVSALQQQVHQLTSHFQNQQLTAQQQVNDQLNSQIEAFKADPSHSHFDDVKGHMAALLQAGQAQNLADAYEQAVFANPTTRALMLQQQEAAKREEAAQRAQVARKAASVNVRNRPTGPATKPIGSMDDTIRDEYRRLTGAA